MQRHFVCLARVLLCEIRGKLQRSALHKHNEPECIHTRSRWPDLKSGDPKSISIDCRANIFFDLSRSAIQHAIQQSGVNKTPRASDMHSIMRTMNAKLNPVNILQLENVGGIFCILSGGGRAFLRPSFSQSIHLAYTFLKSGLSAIGHFV